MAEIKISELTPFTDFDLNDIIPVVDVSDTNILTRTKKYTLADIAGGLNIGSGGGGTSGLTIVNTVNDLATLDITSGEVLVKNPTNGGIFTWSSTGTVNDTNTTWGTTYIEGALLQHSETISGVEHYTGVWGNMNPDGIVMLDPGTYTWNWVYTAVNLVGIKVYLNLLNIPVGSVSLTFTLNGSVITEGECTNLLIEGDNIFVATLTSSVSCLPPGALITASKQPNSSWITKSIDGDINDVIQTISGVEYYTGVWGSMNTSEPVLLTAGTHTWTWIYNANNIQNITGRLNMLNTPSGMSSLTFEVNGTAIGIGGDYSNLLIEGDNTFLATAVVDTTAYVPGAIITATRALSTIGANYDTVFPGLTGFWYNICRYTGGDTNRKFRFKSIDNQKEFVCNTSVNLADPIVYLNGVVQEEDSTYQYRDVTVVFNEPLAENNSILIIN